MNITSLIEDLQLAHDLEALAARIREPDHAVSDIVDAAGHQYVDLVMEGGGLLGIALVGYTWALEQMGLRFLGVGGTSAGSINALLLAGLDDPEQAKSPKLLAELARKDFYSFVDGGRDVRDLIDLALDGQPISAFKAMRLVGRFLGVKDRLTRTYGLNPGEHFLHWLGGLLRAQGIATNQDLAARLASRPAGLALRGAEPYADDDATAPAARLVIVTADIWSETRVELPEMAELYWADPAGVNPALFARASMSIPFFFEPLRIEPLPKDAGAWARWNDHAGLYREQTRDGEPPDRALFVDGGILSNFPIDAFHAPNRVPRLPTFGVKLQYDNRVDSTRPYRGDTGFAGLSAFTGMVLNSARHQLDYEFVRRNPDYKHLVQYIPCVREYPDGRTEPVDWIDFNLPDEDKELLFRQGAEKAIEFVRTFSSPVDASGKTVPEPGSDGFTSKWAFYKELRRRIAQVVRPG